MTEAPLVSVVMTAHNGVAFIAEAIEGVLAQTHETLELIVVDDASSDGTIDVIKGFTDQRIRLIRNGQNQGISTSRNIGIDAAKGKYIAGHDQDDISLPGRLETSVQALEAHEKAVLVANRSRFWSNGALFPSEEVAPPHVIAWRLFTRSNIYTSAICMRAETLRTHGIRYQQTYHYAEDFELYHRLSEIGDIVHLPEVLTVIRDHGANTSIVKRPEMDANAKRFLRARYQDYVGADVTDMDMDLVWLIGVFGVPARSIADLSRLGSLLERLTEAFIERRHLSEEQKADVLEDAARFWWRIVKRTAQHLGPRCLSLRAAFPTLAIKAPPFGDRSSAALRALAGPLYYRLAGKT